MARERAISQEEFGGTAARLGLSGDAAHMEELYSQVDGVLRGTQSLKDIDVAGLEPDLAFLPLGRMPTPE